MKKFGLLVSMLLCSLLLPGQTAADFEARIKQATKARDLEAMLAISQEIDAMYEAGTVDQELNEQYILLWNMIGFHLIGQNRFTEAIEGLSHAMTLTGENKALYQRTCSTLGQAYSYWSLSENAHHRFEHAIELSHRAIDYALEGLNGNLFVGEHIALSRLLTALYRLDEAEQTLVQAFQYNEDLKGKRYAQYKGDIGTQLGEIYVLREKYPDAIELLEEAFGIYYELDSEIGKHKMMVISTKLANLYDLQLHNQEKAKFWKDITAELEAESDPHTSMRESEMLSQVQRMSEAAKAGAIGDKEEAIRLYRELIRDMLANPNADRTTVADCYQNVGTLNISLGRFDEAQEALQTAIKYLEGQPISPVTVNSHHFLSIAYARQEKYTEAVAAAARAAALGDSIYDSDSQKRAELYKFLANFQAFNNDTEAAKQNLMIMMEISMRNIRKTFSYLTAQERESYWNELQENLLIMQPFLYLMRENNSIYTDALYDVQLLCKGLLLQSEIEMQRIVEQSPELRELTEQLSALKHQIALEQESPDSLRVMKMQAEWLEQELIAKSRQMGDYLRFLDITHEDVRSALPQGTAAIEFGTFRYRKDSMMTVAYVMKPEWQHVRVVALFDQRRWDAIPARQLYTTPEAYQLVWAPILEAVGEVDTIYFAPSGSLYNTAIEYLPDEDEQYIGDRIPMVRLSSTRRLAMHPDKAKGQRAVLFGGLRYREDSKWRYLDGSLNEVNSLSKVLRKSKLYTADKGNEAAFDQLSGSEYGILHIATHGFSLAVPEAEQQNLHSGLQYCGLVLSGGGDTPAGQRIPTAQDGILTAQELSLMDLSRCQIAVLSACRTALGVISSDGVLGLQRGLKMAGVETLILSLWDVNDQATQLLMTEFYRNWIMHRQSKREAFRNAQNTVRQRYEEPDYWAGFILLD